MNSLYNRNIQTLKGVGEKRAGLFQKLGAPTIGALLYSFPRAYQDLSSPVPILEAAADRPCAVKAAVISPPREIRVRGGLTLYKATATDGVSDLELTFFNNPYIGNLLHEDEEYIFYGRVSRDFFKREMSAPEFFPAATCPPVRPVYRQTQGLSSRLVENAVKNALALLPDVLRDPIPEPVRAEYGLCHLRFALQNIHFPKNMEDLETARRRLIFEELLVLQLGLLRMKSRCRKKSRFCLRRDASEAFYRLLPFSPTGAQKRAVREGIQDMMSGRPMSRLVQGDVGSGKTAVAAALCHTAVVNGLQAAFMAPTEILAQQHYRTLTGLLSGTGIRLALLTGSLPAAQKRSILEGLRSGEIQLIIGTHALLAENVVFSRLGLVVTDEQHRFGVAQRAALSAKGDDPHLLVMSATPIPRTLALMIYGDLDLSVLDELPPGRQQIATYAIPGAKRLRAFRFLRANVEAGRQCYIICPMIDEGQNDMASVRQYAEKLSREWMPGCSIATLHGKMKPKEKESVMAGFAAGRFSILVSTTVVEVGVDVPNATVMMIENAERYGLSQLHQLRGRVGRGKEKSTCILVSDAQNEEAVTRLKIMCSTGDGFRIAEQDLRLRGPGDFFGRRQHGLPDLKIADMATDMDALRQAQRAAKQLLDEDRALELPEHRGLRAEVNRLFEIMEVS
jgi:ATP-dependent DNA helicase RecG